MAYLVISFFNFIVFNKSFDFFFVFFNFLLISEIYVNKLVRDFFSDHTIINNASTVLRPLNSLHETIINLRPPFLLFFFFYKKQSLAVNLHCCGQNPTPEHSEAQKQANQHHECRPQTRNYLRFSRHNIVIFAQMLEPDDVIRARLQRRIAGY